MTTYAEKADIAAKAVKVLDSVTMSRQTVSAKNYARLARKNLLNCEHEHGSGYLYGFRTKASPAIEQIDMALESMLKRLDKPRYTLKDGEWVRKHENRGGPRGNWELPVMMTDKEANALRNREFAAMAQNMGACGYNHLAGRFNNPRIVDQMDSGIASAYTGGGAF